MMYFLSGLGGGEALLIVYFSIVFQKFLDVITVDTILQYHFSSFVVCKEEWPKYESHFISTFIDYNHVCFRNTYVIKKYATEFLKKLWKLIIFKCVNQYYLLYNGTKCN